MIGAYIIGIVFAIIGLIVSGVLKSKFKKYSQIPVKGGLTGKDRKPERIGLQFR